MIRRSARPCLAVLVSTVLAGCGTGAPDAGWPSLALKPGETLDGGSCNVRAAPAIDVEPAGADIDVRLPPRPDTDVAALDARFQQLAGAWRAARDQAAQALIADGGETSAATAVAVSRWEAAFLALAEVETALLALRRAYANADAFAAAEPQAAALLKQISDIRAEHLRRYGDTPALTAAPASAAREAQGQTALVSASCAVPEDG